MITLDNTTAIVSGAARGIGAACARRFAEHGARVVLADVLGDECAETARGIEADIGAECLAVRADVSDPADCARIVAECGSRFGACHVLLNNAGIIRRGSVLDLSAEQFDEVIAVNLRGPFLLGREAARDMVRRGVRGTIINMSSTNAVVTIPDQVAYAASKGGVAQLTRAMAVGLAQHGIRVNAIGPGTIETDILKVVVRDDEARRTILSRTPLGRFGDPREVADVAVFLASDYSSYLTGETIYPDGGRLSLNYTVPVREDD